MSRNYTKDEQQESLTYLKKHVAQGAKVLCVLRRVSDSGMTRIIDLKTVDKGGDLIPLGFHAARLLDLPHNRIVGGICIRGAGMDMGFHLVYQLGRALFPSGGKLKHSSRSRQESAAGFVIETDGGYLLRHEWV